MQSAEFRLVGNPGIGNRPDYACCSGGRPQGTDGGAGTTQRTTTV